MKSHTDLIYTNSISHILVLQYNRMVIYLLIQFIRFFDVSLRFFHILLQMNLRSSLLLITSVSHPKFALPARLKAMGRRAVFLITFFVLFMMVRLQMMKNAPVFPG